MLELWGLFAPLARLPHLRTLRLFRAGLRRANFAGLAQLAGLRELVLQNCSVDDPLLMALLEELSVVGCRGLGRIQAELMWLAALMSKPGLRCIRYTPWEFSRHENLKDCYGCEGGLFSHTKVINELARVLGVDLDMPDV
jgi:hypothetical protein